MTSQSPDEYGQQQHGHSRGLSSDLSVQLSSFALLSPLGVLVRRDDGLL